MIQSGTLIKIIDNTGAKTLDGWFQCPDLHQSYELRPDGETKSHFKVPGWERDKSAQGG